jgi:hypothetical protein
MRAGPSSLSIACPNKIRGVYSRPAAGRVSGGGRGAGWGIFRPRAAIGLAIGSARRWALGVNVGRELSVDSLRTHAFPSISALDRLMVRWAGPISALPSGRPGAPLAIARVSGHPVARVGSEIWKIFGLSAAFNRFLASVQARYAKSPANGSGCGRQARQFQIKRVGDRLIFAENARFSSISGLSRPGLEAATLSGGWAGVN